MLTLPEKIDNTKVLEILKRKKEGIDCTEDESAELKGYLRDSLKLFGINKDSVSIEIEQLFPLEYSEFIDELF